MRTTYGELYLKSLQALPSDLGLSDSPTANARRAAFKAVVEARPIEPAPPSTAAAQARRATAIDVEATTRAEASAPIEDGSVGT